MTVYVIRDGVLVLKDGNRSVRGVGSDFPIPMISRFEPMLSPVTEKEITSWRERERDMQAANAFDVRDLPKDFVFSRGRDVQLKEARDARERQSEPAVWRSPEKPA
jgi:hypothetical protein